MKGFTQLVYAALHIITITTLVTHGAQIPTATTYDKTLYSLSTCAFSGCFGNQLFISINSGTVATKIISFKQYTKQVIMQKSIQVIIALTLISFTLAQVRFNGPCPSGVTVQSNFNTNAYQGVWYEYAKYPVHFEAGGKCVKGNLTLKPNGDYLVVNSMVHLSNNKWHSSFGNAVVVENAKLKVTFPTSRPNNDTSNYWVLSTDYNNYSVVYYCRPAGENSHSVVAWILSREIHLPEKYIAIAKDVFIKNGVSLSELVVTDQTNCDLALGEDA